MSFFNSWVLWQKMTFVLACAIVVTVSTAVSRLAYTKRQLQRYAAGAILETSALRPTLPIPQPPDIEAQSGKVPFGIRAIEAGIEVDGVWISKPNTPSSSRPSSLASFGSRRYPQSVISQGSLLSPNDPDVTGFASSASSVHSRSGRSPERPGPAQRVNSANSLLSVESCTNPSLTTTPNRSMGNSHDRVRGKSLPRDLLFLDLAEAATYNFQQRSPRHSFTRSPLQLPHPSPRLSTIIDEPVIELTDNPSKHAAQESVETISSLHTEVNTPNLTSTETTPDAKRSISSMETKYTELSLIEQHRLQQVASTGQLKPRQRTSTEETFDAHPIYTPLPLPEIRIEAVPDAFEEQDLGLRRVESDAFSFIHGEEDTIDTRDFARDDVENQVGRRSKRASWLVRPAFTRAKTEGTSSESRFQDLFRTTSEQPHSSQTRLQDLFRTTADQSAHPLRRVKKGLLETGGARGWGPERAAAEIAQEGEFSNQARTPRKLQKKRGSRSSLRNVFYSAVGHSDKASR